MKSFIHINDLEVECLIGCLKDERHSPQIVVVNIEAQVDSIKAAYTDKIVHTLNFADVAKEVSFILKAGQFSLLETACAFILHYLFIPPLPQRDYRPQVKGAKVSLLKAKPFPGNTSAGVVVRANVDEMKQVIDAMKTKTPWGDFSTIYQNQNLALSCLNLNPKKEINFGMLKQGKGEFYSLTDGLRSDSQGAFNPHPYPVSFLYLGTPFK